MLIEQLKNERMEAMKLKSTIKEGINIHEIKMNLLSTLIGDACEVDKVPSNEKVIAVIKKFIKNSEEVLKEVISRNYMFETEDKIKTELSILEGYLPTQLTNDEIRAIMSKYTAIQTSVGVQPSMKVLMEHFKEEYDGQYDGKSVSTIAKEFI